MTKILIVDDIESNLYLLKALLVGHGYEVESAKNGAEALACANASPPDLIVTDVLMPLIDGFELCRLCKRDTRLEHIAIVIYTATYTDAKAERLAFALGAQRFLIKPQTPERLLSIVSEVLVEAAQGNIRKRTGDEGELLRQHNDALSQKLEKKVRELEAEIARREEVHAQLDAIVSNIPDVVTLVDHAGRVAFVNRLLPPYTREQTIGARWIDCVPRGQHEIVSEILHRVFADGVGGSFESTAHGADGSTLWSSNHVGAVKRAGQVVGAVIVARDVTERKRTDALLIASDRMASVGILAAGVAHEINNPLAVVTANLELASRSVKDLSARFDLPTDLLEQVGDASECAQRIAVIVQDLKIFSRAEAEQRGPVDTKRVMESTLRMVRNEIRHRARLVRDYGDAPWVEANESRIGQVFLNLITNAAHAIPEGRTEANEIRVAIRPGPSGEVIIEIADTGTGMPPEVQDRLFTAFFTTKPPGVGTGLGLTICERIVRDLGGKIEFESELGKGSTFRVHLPRAHSAATQSAPQPPVVRGATGHGRVLVVDDEPLLCAVIHDILSEDHHVVTVTRARDALDRISAGERFDVIVCDLMMPEMTGMELHDELVRCAPDQAARIVFTTGGAFTPRAREFLDRVPNTRLEKPFALRRLQALVSDSIARA